MSAFWTFAICLTTAYAIYYTVTILLDLNGKTKEKSNDSMETFELKNVQETPGKVVEETEGGFLSAGALCGADDLTVSVQGNADRILLISRFDNLGKGASGAAIQNMNLVLGLPEDTGLVRSAHE